MAESVHKLIYRTLSDPRRWNEVLEELCKRTGASGAIITTRQKRDSAIVITENMTAGDNGSFLYGLSSERLQSYSEQFWQHDIWSVIENANRPYRPYSLSKFLTLEELKETEFWNWLEPQNIDDTIVAELFHCKTHWVALNVFYQLEQDDVQDAIFALLGETLTDLQSVWKMRVELDSAQALISPEQNAALNQSHAAILLSWGAEIISINADAKRLLGETDLIRVSNDIMHFRDRKAQEWLLTNTRSTDCLKSEEAQAELKGSFVLRDHDLEGRIVQMSAPIKELGTRGPVFLLSLLPLNKFALLSKEDVLNHPKLTKTQVKLVEHIMADNSVASFARLQGIRNDTAYKHWDKIKKKLNVDTPKQLSRLS